MRFTQRPVNTIRMHTGIHRTCLNYFPFNPGFHTKPTLSSAHASLGYEEQLTPVPDWFFPHTIPDVADDQYEGQIPRPPQFLPKPTGELLDHFHCASVVRWRATADDITVRRRMKGRTGARRTHKHGDNDTGVENCRPAANDKR